MLIAYFKYEVAAGTDIVINVNREVPDSFENVLQFQIDAGVIWRGVFIVNQQPPA